MMRCPHCQKKISRVHDIISAVEEYFDLPDGAILSDRRTRELAYARQLAMMMAVDMTRHSYVSLGGIFNRDHSTIIHGEKAARERVNSIPEWKQDYDAVWGQLA